MMIKSLSAAVLAASLAVAPAAFAQTPRDFAQGAYAAMRGGMEFNRDEQNYVMQTGMTGAVALRTSQIAQRKVSDPRLRSFADSEVMEQETISRILMEHGQMIGRPMAPPAPDPRMAPVISELERTPRGLQFDRAYLRGQIQGHEELLRIQEQYIRGGRNTHLRHVAMLARGQITDHLKMLREVQGTLRTASR
jgi:putative membrane protein